MQWRGRLSPLLLQTAMALQECDACLPSHEGAGVDVCRECRASFDSGRLPKACSVNNMAIGCEHRYPEELDDLSPVEERLIALHAPFGYITKFTVDNKTRSGISYRKHVKGHIVVFPNKVDDLVATVLPHPLLQAIENIHVSWSGSAKPGSADVRNLLQVRKSRVAAALAWLQRNNPLYEGIAINQAEMDGWQYADGSTVPTVIMDRMRREEPSTVEKTQTDHIVPDTDRGLQENSFRSIDELVNSIDPTFIAESCDLNCTLSTEQTQPLLVSR
ncbi:PIF1 protein [Hirsutella rhossiliensis]